MEEGILATILNKSIKTLYLWCIIQTAFLWTVIMMSSIINSIISLLLLLLQQLHVLVEFLSVD